MQNVFDYTHYYRTFFTALLTILAVMLFLCTLEAFKSKKKISKKLAFLISALIPPVFGNAIIISSQFKTFSAIGYYLYFYGMDIVMYALVSFAFAYCEFEGYHKIKNILHIILLLDVAQYLFNPFFHQAFSLTEIEVYGKPYWEFIPYLGQTIHRIIDYSVLFIAFMIMIFKIIKTPRVSRVKYTTILLSMIVVTIWQSFYIFSKSPIDRSMIGFAAFGLAIHYFCLYYKPIRLINSILANVASNMDDAYFLFDDKVNAIWLNNKALKFVNINENDDLNLSKKFIDATFPNIDHSLNEYYYTRKIEYNGETKYYKLTKKSVIEKDDKKIGSFFIISDKTNEILELEKERYDARHDKLTSIYNKDYLFAEVNKRIRSNDKNYTIVYLDISDFKLVNDVYGHAFGDLVLKSLADYLRRVLTPLDDCVFGRISGDVFGICLSEKCFDAKTLEENIKNFIVKNDRVEYKVLIHAGIYKNVDKNLDASVLFDRAHMAISLIKDDHHRYIAYYNDEMRSDTLWNQLISSELESAIKNKQIIPYIQAIVDTEGKIVGGEVLVRWDHPRYGLLTPSKFVPIFEKNSMITTIDKYMWRCACEILSNFKKKDMDLFISINISPKDFYFLDVHKELLDLVKEYDIEPKNLRIEITETTMMTDKENRVSILNEIKKSGFIIEMDDFGSGYSSLNMLKDMPVDLLKIDMMFINDSNYKQKTQTIIKNIVTLSDELGIVSLTEGVENVDQFKMLQDMGCKLYQGFYFSKPLPVNEFEELYIKSKNQPFIIN